MIYIVLELQREDINLNSEDKTQLLEKLKTAMFNYTSDKIREQGVEDNLVYDIEFLFGILEPKFQSPKEKQKFYENYVLCMVNYCNCLDEEKEMLWECIAEIDPTTVYPKIEEKEHIILFQTDEKTLYKDAALWLFSYMNNKYENKEGNVKKKEVIYVIK